MNSRRSSVVGLAVETRGRPTAARSVCRRVCSRDLQCGRFVLLHRDADRGGATAGRFAGVVANACRHGGSRGFASIGFRQCFPSVGRRSELFLCCHQVLSVFLQFPIALF
ncbi:hypothetical protein RYX36_021498 [Vicia faba]